MRCDKPAARLLINPPAPEVTMNIIFLDIDGVLNNYLWLEDVVYRLRPDDHVRQENIVQFNRLVDVIDYKVVITSTWRIGKSLEFFHELFRKHGIHGEVVGMTAEHGRSRFAQITDWMDLTFVDRYLVIDDDDVYEELRVMPTMRRLAIDHFIHTNKFIGLSEDDVDHAIFLAKEVFP